MFRTRSFSPKFKNLFFLGCIIGVFLLGCSFFQRNEDAPRAVSNTYAIDTLATDLIVPWEIVFLPDSTMLFTERNGNVRIFREGKLLTEPALVITDIDTTKKMGLLGLAVHPKFEETRYVYLAHNYQEEGSSYLKVLRFRFEDDRLLEPKLIVGGINANQNHTGCRLKFSPDGKLFITTGDADQAMLAQDLTSLNGKILRVNDDGTVPNDNPFVAIDTVRKEIWSYGHRNVQGLDFQPDTGFIYNSEHGPTGGDEINRIYKGANYGWPVIHHQATQKGMFSPIKEFTPSVGPSDIIFYDSEILPSLKGSLLLACLRGEGIVRLIVNNQQVVQQEVLFKNIFGRIRALTVGPDGYIYFSTSQQDPPEGKPGLKSDLLLRLRPATPADTDLIAYSSEPLATKTESAPMDNTPKGHYDQLCASCHGPNFEGTERAHSLKDGQWQYASNKIQIKSIIEKGLIQEGMPAWEGALSEGDIDDLAEFIFENSNK